MDFHEVVGLRRAVRHFRPDPVARTVLERIIGTAALAPSAMNLQPWSFAVLTGTGRLADCARRAKAHLLGQPALPQELRQMLEDASLDILYGAPVLALVLATSAEEQAREDCCLAAQNLLLAARDEDLGSCWIGLARPFLNLPETKVELGIPAEHHVVAPIVLGYPVAWPANPGRRPAAIRWL